MKLTKNIITREEALAICPNYVVFAEGDRDNLETVCKPFWWDHDNTDRHGGPTCGIKRGQKAITFHDGQFIKVRVSAVQNPMHDADGPVVRVSNGEYSWRVDGDKYAFLMPERTK